MLYFQQAGLISYEVHWTNKEWQEKTEPLRLEHFKFCKIDHYLETEDKLFFSVYFCHGIGIIISGLVNAVQTAFVKEKRRSITLNILIFSCVLSICVAFTILVSLMVEHELNKWNVKTEYN